MDKALLEDAARRRLSTHRMADELGCSQTNVMYWLRKHGLKTDTSVRRGIKRKGLNVSCYICGKPTKEGRRLCPCCTIKVRRYRVKLDGKPLAVERRTVQEHRKVHSCTRTYCRGLGER